MSPAAVQLQLSVAIVKLSSCEQLRITSSNPSTRRVLCGLVVQWRLESGKPRFPMYR